MTTTINKLSGQSLIDHVTNGEINGLTKTEQCLTAGYVRNNGKAAYVDFYTELLNAKTEAGLINDSNELNADEEWYGCLTEQQQELYDAIEDRCPEFQKLSTDDCDAFMSELEEIGIYTADAFNDAYYGLQHGWNPERDFAEEYCAELYPSVDDNPYWFAIDWQRVWDHCLSYDFSTIELDGVTYFFHNN